MNELQLIFMGVMTALVVAVVLLLVFTDLADRLPADPWKRKQ